MSKNDIIILLVLLSILGWAFANGFSMAVSTLEEQNDNLLQRIWDLQKIDRQKCADLLLNDMI